MKKIVFALLIALLVLTACEQPKACTHSATETKVITAATCTESGENAIVCKNCGETLKTEVADKLGHDLKVTEVTPATCTEPRTQTMKCMRSGCEHTEERRLPALGHDLEETETPATCKDDGLLVKACKRCTFREETTIPKTNNHTANGDPAEIITAPTCTESGKGNYTCDVCGGTFEDAIAAKGHGETIMFNTQKAATADDNILFTNYCVVCKEPAEEPVSFGTPSEFTKLDSSVSAIIDDIFSVLNQKINSTTPEAIDDTKKYSTYTGDITGNSGKTYSVDCSMGQMNFTGEYPTACIYGTLIEGETSYEFKIVTNFDFASIAFFVEVNGIKGSYMTPITKGASVTVFGKATKVFYIKDDLTLAVFTEPLTAPDGTKLMQWGSFGKFIGDGDSATCNEGGFGYGAVNTEKIMKDEDAFYGWTSDSNPIDPANNNTVWQALKNFRTEIGDTEGKVHIPSTHELVEILKQMDSLGITLSGDRCWSSYECGDRNQVYSSSSSGNSYSPKSSTYEALVCVQL